MRRSLLLLILALNSAMPAAAQGLPPFPQEEVLVIVWSGSAYCSVLDRKTNCSRVASLMTSALQVGRDRSIVVAANSTDQDTMIRVAQLMTDIRAAGFRRVRQADAPH
jgi:enterochelin esterase-like enzyme